jgi:signal transduction histidine kinase
MTIRARLTLAYGLLFVAVGAGLLAINYGLLRHNIPARDLNIAAAQVVVLRAQKLQTDPSLTVQDRNLLQQVARTNPPDAARTAARLPARLSKLLLADLPSDVRNRALSALLRQSILALGLGALVAFGLGWLIAGRVLRPLDTITETARQLSASNLDQRIGLTGPDDEIKRLADTFDDMLARLESAFASQRRFVADASHELRTPLTIMRTELDVTLRKGHPTNEQLMAMASVLSNTVDRSDALVSSLLALATSNHGLETIVHADLAVVVRDALGRRAAQAAQRAITIKTELDPAPIDGDGPLLDRLVDNLLDNSIRHNSHHGWIHVCTHNQHETVSITVANATATTIPPEDAKALFEPFHRAKRAPDGGHGLGLSIVRSITLAHHGQTRVDYTENGQFAITVTLPRRQPT